MAFLYELVDFKVTQEVGYRSGTYPTSAAGSSFSPFTENHQFFSAAGRPGFDSRKGAGIFLSVITVCRQAGGAVCPSDWVVKEVGSWMVRLGMRGALPPSAHMFTWLVLVCRQMALIY